MSIYACKGYLVDNSVLNKIDSIENLTKIFSTYDISLFRKDANTTVISYKDVCLNNHEEDPDVRYLLMGGYLEMEFGSEKSEYRFFSNIEDIFQKYKLDFGDYEDFFIFGIFCLVT